MRFTVADRVPGLATIFYATPLPLVAAFSFVGALLGVLFRQRKTALLLLVTLLCSGALWHAKSWESHSGTSQPSDLRAVFWNFAHQGLKGPLARSIRKSGADIFAMVESGIDREETIDRLQRKTRGYNIRAIGPEMLIAVRGIILESHRVRIQKCINYGVVKVRVSGRTFTVIVVDISANPWHSRRPAFEHLIRAIDKHAGGNLVIVGDFNTPYESIWFNALRARLTHAFAIAGTGFIETWPFHLPILALDHIWLGPSLHATSAHVLRTRHSDHAAVTATVRVDPSPAAE